MRNSYARVITQLYVSRQELPMKVVASDTALHFAVEDTPLAQRIRVPIFREMCRKRGKELLT